MLHISFKKQGGQDMNLFLVSEQSRTQALSSLSVNGYTVTAHKDENPWELLNADIMYAVRYRAGSLMLLADPLRDTSKDSAASLLVKAMEFYAPGVISDKIETIHRPIEYGGF